jgi:hypothetical protein
MVNKMLMQDDRKRLRGLGLRTSPEVIREAEQRIRNGESVYKLHTGDPPLLAKATARKIKGLLDGNKLGFLFDDQQSRAASASLIESTPGGGSFSLYPGVFQAKAEAFNFHQMHFDWHIEQLEKVGIATDEALRLLVEHDCLWASWPRWDPTDLRRFTELSSIAFFSELESQKEKCAPYEYIQHAASAWARGLLEHNPFLLGTGLHLLSYLTISLTGIRS